MKSLILSLLVVCPLMAQNQLTARNVVPGMPAESSLNARNSGQTLLPFTEVAPALPSAYSLPVERNPNPPGRSLFAISVAALAAANAADMASSWGRREANPLLATSNTRFGPQAATIKVGFTAVSLLIQWVALRRNPRLYRTFAYTNFAIAGGLSAVAVRNNSIPR